MIILIAMMLLIKLLSRKEISIPFVPSGCKNVCSFALSNKLSYAYHVPYNSRGQHLKIYQWEQFANIEHSPASLVQFSSVAQSCPTLCNPLDCSTQGFPVHHQLLESTQTHAHWVSDAIQPSHLLSSPSSPALNLSQHQGLFKWLSSSHQVAKVLEFQLQHQSFRWTFRTGFL